MKSGVLIPALLLAMFSVSAEAGDALVSSSEQGVALFSKTCMIYAGQKDKLRAWMEGQKIPRASPEAAAMMKGIPGQAFAFMTPAGNFMIGSQDDGGCTVFVQHADGKVVAANFEKIVGLSQFKMKITSDRDDAQNAAIHHKGYDISGEHRMWRVVISSTPPGKYPLDVIMTAYSANLASSGPGTAQ